MTVVLICGRRFLGRGLGGVLRRGLGRVLGVGVGVNGGGGGGGECWGDAGLGWWWWVLVVGFGGLGRGWLFEEGDSNRSL